MKKINIHHTNYGILRRRKIPVIKAISFCGHQQCLKKLYICCKTFELLWPTYIPITKTMSSCDWHPHYCKNTISICDKEGLHVANSLSCYNHNFVVAKLWAFVTNINSSWKTMSFGNQLARRCKYFMFKNKLAHFIKVQIK